MLHLFQKSAESFLREAIPDAADVNFAMWDPEFGPNVVRMVITDNGSSAFVGKLRTALKQFTQMLPGFKFDFVDKFEGEVSVSESTCSAAPSNAHKDRMMEVIDLMTFVMDGRGDRLRNGVIVRRDPRSTASYTVETTVRDYLNDICLVDQYKGVVTPKIDQVVNFFRNNPRYKGVKTIRIDTNLIEVSTRLNH